MSFVKTSSEDKKPEKTPVPSIVWAPLHPVLKMRNPVKTFVKDHLVDYHEVNPFAEAEASAGGMGGGRGGGRGGGGCARHHP